MMMSMLASNNLAFDIIMTDKVETNKDCNLMHLRCVWDVIEKLHLNFYMWGYSMNIQLNIDNF